MKPRIRDNGIQYLFVLFILSCLLLTLLVPGCSQPPPPAPALPSTQPSLPSVPEPAPEPAPAQTPAEPSPTLPSSIPAPDTPTTPTTGTAPSTSILAQLKLSDAPALNKEIEVVATFALRESYVGDAENVTARLMLTDAFELVESELKSHEELISYARIPAESVEKNETLIQWELAHGSILTEDPVTGDAIFSTKYTIVEWNGDMAGGETIKIKAKVKAARITPTVDWDKIEARAGFSPSPWSYDGGSEVIYVRIYEDHGDISEMPPVPPESLNNPSNIDESPPPEPTPPPSETDKSGTKDFRNSLAITGSFECYVSEDVVPPQGTPRSDNSTPMVWGGVFIHNSSTDALIGSGTTGTEAAAGEFEIAVENPWPDGFRIRVKPHSTIASVTDNSSTIYSHLYSSAWYPTENQTEIDVGYLSINWTGYSIGAWRIYETIANDYYDRGAWDFLKNEGPGLEMPQIKVIYPSSENTCYWEYDEKIRIKENDDTKALDTVQHEYGHAVMDQCFGSIPTDPNCGKHYIKSASDTTAAWVEGWAEFFPLWVQNCGRDASDYDYVYEYGGGEQEDLEKPTWGTSNWVGGDDVEGRVAGALWDIYDSVDDNYTSPHYYDKYDGGFDIIWGTFCNYTSDNFSQFWTDWQERAAGLGREDEKYDALQSIYQNTIPYYADFDIDLVEDYNLMSLPLIPESSNVTNLVANINLHKASAYVAADESCPCPPGFPGWYYYYHNPPPDWPPGDPFPPNPSWNTLTDLYDGQGCWFDMHEDDTLTFDGHILNPPPASPPAYDVFEGWNMIGFTSTDNRTPQDYLADILGIISMMYGWNQEQQEYYIPGTQGHEYLLPCSGYWLATTDNGTIYPYNQGGGRSSGMGTLERMAELLKNPGAWDISLSVSANTIVFFGTATIGVHPEAIGGFDRFLDLPAPPPPPVEDGLEIYSWNQGNTSSWQRKLFTNYMPPTDLIKWELQVKYFGTERASKKVVLSWDKAEVTAVPREYGLFLLDEKGNELANMRKVTSYTFEMKVPKDAKYNITTFQIQARRK
jgi:hypothetical protein